MDDMDCWLQLQGRAPLSPSYRVTWTQGELTRAATGQNR